jgi:uncharacterized membrane protein
MKTATFVAWLVGLIVLNIMDALWHAVIFTDTYARGLADLGVFKDGELTINQAYLFVVQVIFVIGILYFVVTRLSEQDRVMGALLQGALFGFIAYGFHALINLSIIANYELSMAIHDIIRGPLIGAVIGLVTVLTYDSMEKRKKSS